MTVIVHQTLQTVAVHRAAGRALTRDSCPAGPVPPVEGEQLYGVAASVNITGHRRLFLRRKVKGGREGGKGWWGDSEEEGGGGGDVAWASSRPVLVEVNSPPNAAV